MRTPSLDSEDNHQVISGCCLVHWGVMLTQPGLFFTHLAEEEQGPACDWDHMQGRQVTGVISHTAQ